MATKKIIKSAAQHNLRAPQMPRGAPQKWQSAFVTRHQYKSHWCLPFNHSLTIRARWNRPRSQKTIYPTTPLSRLIHHSKALVKAASLRSSVIDPFVIKKHSLRNGCSEASRTMREKAIRHGELVSKGRKTNKSSDNCMSKDTGSMKYLQQINWQRLWELIHRQILQFGPKIFCPRTVILQVWINPERERRSIMWH